MQIGICEWCAGMGGEAMFQRLKRVGLCGVQVSYEPAAFADKMERYAAWAAEYGVSLVSVGANIFCERPLFRPEHAAELDAVVADIAAQAVHTENRLFHVPAFGAGEIHSAEELEQMTAGLRRVCDIAAEWKVTVASENALSLAENQRLLAEVDRPNFCIYYDGQNTELAQGDAMEQAAAFAAASAEAHIKDCNATGRSVPLGQGVTRAADTLAALQRGGFDGWFLLENAFEGVAEDEMRADMAWLQKEWTANAQQ